jgi:type IV pilus assembly protein PilV
MSATQNSTSSIRRRRASGFSLVEVMVALIVVGVGMLGIAKIQAMAYASTGTASLRSLAAIEASSLAAAMRANRNYWTLSSNTPVNIQVTGASYPNPPTISPSVAGPVCIYSVTPTCTPAQLANYDLSTWATTINTMLPSVIATVSCPAPVPDAGGLTPPVGCTIQMNWAERNPGTNTESINTTMTSPTYTLYVVP